ncbi:MAG: GNAT family N-acetyltransferase [Erysipelotrichaceae bacterium]
MPISNIIQPDNITVSEDIRLVKFYRPYPFAYKWYQDIDTVKMVDGVEVERSAAEVDNMYNYQAKNSELYFIEVKDAEGNYCPIGDCSFELTDITIVIGDKEYRHKSIGKKVIGALIDRARQLQLKKVYVSDIYDFNLASRKLFTSLGFKVDQKTKLGHSYKLDID